VPNPVAQLIGLADHAIVVASVVVKVVDAQNLERVATIANAARVVALKKPAANVFRFATRRASAAQITIVALDASAKNANQSDLYFSIF